MKQDLTLQKFPFDSQKIAIRFGMTLYGAEDVLLLNRTDPSVVASFDEHVKQLHEWGMEGSSKLEVRESFFFYLFFFFFFLFCCVGESVFSLGACCVQ